MPSLKPNANQLVREGRFFRSHEAHVSGGPRILNDPMPTEPTVLETGSWEMQASCSACGWVSPNVYDESEKSKAYAEADEHLRLGNARRKPGDFISEKDHPDNW